MDRERLYSVYPIDSLEEKREFLITGEIPMTFRGSRILFASSLEGMDVVIKIPKDRQSTEREWKGLTKSATAGIPVPKPLLLGLNDLGRLCIVSERIHGIPLFLNHDRKTRTQLGQLIREMHARVAIEGKRWLESGMTDYKYYDEQVNQWVGSQELICRGFKGKSSKSIGFHYKRNFVERTINS